MIKVDADLDRYPVWTKVEDEDYYAAGWWTKKGRFTYAILEPNEGYGPFYPEQLIRRYGTGSKTIESAKWRIVDPSDYDKHFPPGEIDQLIMEMML